VTNVKHTPPLPSLRTLAAELRELHEDWQHPIAGPDEATLVCLDTSNGEKPGWRVIACSNVANVHGAVIAVCDARELVGHNTFDATGSARRLLASARDAGFK
jgi:hypothetical protein